MRVNPSRNVPKTTAKRAVPFGLSNMHYRGLMNPCVTLLEIHKVVNFMQAAGGIDLSHLAMPTYGL